MALFGRNKQTPKKAKNLDRIRKLISRAEKRGYIFPEDLKSDLSNYSTQKLKGLTAKKLYSMAKAVDKETGEIFSGTEYRKRERSLSAKLGALTRKAKEAIGKVLGRDKKPAPSALPGPAGGTASGPGPAAGPSGGPSGPVAGPSGGPSGPAPVPAKQAQQPPNIPDGGGIIFQNVLDEFISRLQEPVPGYGTSVRGRSYRRPGELVNTIERSKQFLLGLVNKVLGEIGPSQLGWRLQQNADTVSTCMEYFVYTSDGSAVQTATATLASIINGAPLSLSQSLDLGAQSEFNEDWDAPD